MGLKGAESWNGEAEGMCWNNVRERQEREGKISCLFQIQHRCERLLLHSQKKGEKKNWDKTGREEGQQRIVGSKWVVRGDSRNRRRWVGIYLKRGLVIKYETAAIVWTKQCERGIKCSFSSLMLYTSSSCLPMIESSNKLCIINGAGLGFFVFCTWFSSSVKRMRLYACSWVVEWSLLR